MGFVGFLFGWLEKKFGEDVAVTVALSAVVLAAVGAVVALISLSTGVVVSLVAGFVAAVAVAAGVLSAAVVLSVAEGALSARAGAGAVGAVAAGAVVAGAFFLLTFYGILNLPELIIVALAVFVLGEIFFWASKRIPRKNENKFWFTAKFKALFFIEAFFWVVQVSGVFPAIKAIGGWLDLNASAMVSFSYGVGVLVLFLAVMFVWVKINEQKFKSARKKRGGKRG